MGVEEEGAGGAEAEAEDWGVGGGVSFFGDEDLDGSAQGVGGGEEGGFGGRGELDLAVHGVGAEEGADGGVVARGGERELEVSGSEAEIGIS